MKEIILQNVPQQRIEVDIDGVNYVLQFRTSQGLTIADVYADTELLKAGVVCAPGAALIPYKYLTRGGNFYFYCAENDYPYYEYFTSTQFLFYLTDAEIEELDNRS